MTTPKPYSTDLAKDPGPWIITEDQIHEIKKGNPLAISKFYFENYGTLLNIAKKICNDRQNLGTIRGEICEYVSQVFVDLADYEFSTRTHFYNCIKQSMLLADCGGYSVRNKERPKAGTITSYDAFLTDEGFSLLDTLTDGITPHDELILKDLMLENDRKVLAYIEKTFTDPVELNTMFCYLFTDLPPSRIEGNEYVNFRQYTKTLAC